MAAHAEIVTNWTAAQKAAAREQSDAFSKRLAAAAEAAKDAMAKRIQHAEQVQGKAEATHAQADQHVDAMESHNKENLASIRENVCFGVRNVMFCCMFAVFLSHW